MSPAPHFATAGDYIVDASGVTWLVICRLCGHRLLRLTAADARSAIRAHLTGVHPGQHRKMDGRRGG